MSYYTDFLKRKRTNSSYSDKELNESLGDALGPGPSAKDQNANDQSTIIYWNADCEGHFTYRLYRGTDPVSYADAELISGQLSIKSKGYSAYQKISIDPDVNNDETKRDFAKRLLDNCKRLTSTSTSDYGSRSSGYGIRRIHEPESTILFARPLNRTREPSAVVVLVTDSTSSKCHEASTIKDIKLFVPLEFSAPSHRQNSQAEIDESIRRGTKLAHEIHRRSEGLTKGTWEDPIHQAICEDSILQTCAVVSVPSQNLDEFWYLRDVPGV
ncbi:hypothetical protein I302_100873 [Kwoniella bestiolae CBS 10118]|uniref:Uncharacterized protein n=1 Tax=Kwoniella bestiolae CBS 10118 TaxID=1296100 RepID=A0A1B9G6D2_9TREE|nr:hypothetical protein I302_04247 [Kwoniella bestiolae CBS 10118]OCF26561.1 hypothetical protein I302_04247 [Kwoniella bestiolae CBS 10118]